MRVRCVALLYLKGLLMDAIKWTAKMLALFAAFVYLARNGY